MKSNSLVNPRIAAVTVCGMALAVSVLALRARADEWDKRTILTIQQTVQVTDKVLPPGKYVLKLLDSPSSRNVVQIYNGDQSKYIGTVLAIPAYRMDPTSQTQFTFWETPPGMAKALRAWYYPGDNYGQEFPYPKQLASVETASTTTTTNTSAENTTTSTTTETPAPPPVVAPPVTETTPPVTNNEEEKQAAEMTQPEQPPTTPVEQPTPTPVPTPDNSSADRSAELPATGSPYPAVGALGLLSLLGFAGLRLKRAAKQ
jgi:hypothetical protein